MKICLAIHSLAAGGMERVMTELIWHFSKKENVELHLLLFGKQPDIFYAIPDSIHIHKPTFIFDGSSRFFSTLKTIKYIRKSIKTIQPDTVLSFGNYWNSLVLLSCLGLKYPIYVSDRSKPDKDMGHFQNWLRNRLYPRASGVIAQTKCALTVYQSMYHQDNITVIGNPIREITIPENNIREKVVVSVGRLIDTKHFDRLIRIFSEIDMPDWKLVIVGGDSIKQNNSVKLQDLIDKLCLYERVVLAGKQQDVESYLLKSSIFAFTSSSEGFPNVVGEAMQAGLPVVSYDCMAGPSDMIEDGVNGYLVPVFDDNMFRIRLEKLMKDEVLRTRMEEAAKQSIQQFNCAEICERFYDFICKK